MAEERADEAAAAEGRVERLPILRDANFVRIAADHIAVINRGPEYELVLVVGGPDPSEQEVLLALNGSVLEMRNLHFVSSYSEVARLRISPGTAITTAMQIIERTLEAQRLDLPGFRSAMMTLIDQYEAAAAERATGNTNQPNRSESLDT